MKNNSPQKQAAISWIILMIGILLAVIGAMTAKEYRVNLCLLIGAMVVVGGIVYHLTMMKCPYCGCSLVGYRPIPKECPKCHKKFETSVYKGYKRDKIEMRVDRVEVSDFPLYLNTVAGGLDRRDQTIGGFSFVVKIYALPVVEIIG